MLIFCMDFLRLSYIIPFFFLSLENSFANDLPNIASDKEFFIEKKLELNISLSALADLEKLNLLYQHPEIDHYLKYLLDKILSSNGIKDDDFSIFLVNNNDLNAFALPGKYMGINTGLLLSTQDESELASVVSHELAHITKKHISRMIYAQKKATNVSLAALLIAILASNSNSNLTSGALAGAQANLAQNYFSYSQSHEKEADYAGFEYMIKSGFSPFSSISFLKTLEKKYSFTNSQIPAYLSTHPLTSERIINLTGRVSNLDFKLIEDSLEYKMCKIILKVNSYNKSTLIDRFSKLVEENRHQNDFNIAMKFEFLLTLAALNKEKEFLEIKKEFESNGIQNYILTTIYARFFYSQNERDNSRKYDYYFLAIGDNENYKFLIDEMVEKMVANEDFEIIPPDYLDYDLKTITIKKIKSLLRYHAHFNNDCAFKVLNIYLNFFRGNFNIVSNQIAETNLLCKNEPSIKKQFFNIKRHFNEL